jgi:hypothetical protein
MMKEQKYEVTRGIYAIFEDFFSLPERLGTPRPRIALSSWEKGDA